jgi:hypothetical protein
MAVEGLQDAIVYLGGYNLTGHSNAIDAQYGAEMLDDTVFSDTTRSSKAGMKTFEFTVGGLQDYTTLDSVLYDYIGVTKQVFSFAPSSTDAEGETVFTIRGVNATYAPIGGTVGDLLPFEITGRASNTALVKGELAGIGAKTSSSNATGSQIGALSATQTMYVAAHVTAVSGTSPTLDLTVQSDNSSGFSSATTQITLAQFTAIGAKWGSVDGAITDDYWRLVWTIGGSSTPTFTIFVTLGIL